MVLPTEVCDLFDFGQKEGFEGMAGLALHTSLRAALDSETAASVGLREDQQSCWCC